MTKSTKTKQAKAAADNVAIYAVYVGDSNRFHKYSLEGEGFVGTAYVPKERGAIPDSVSLTLVGPAHEDWIDMAQNLLDGMNPNGKAYANLSRIIADRKGG
jgi:hypothetical protein